MIGIRVYYKEDHNAYGPPMPNIVQECDQKGGVALETVGREWVCVKLERL